MVRSFALCLCLSTVSAGADCLPDGALPTRLTYSSGAVIEVASRDGERISYRQTIVETGQQVDMTVHAGIFTVSALRDGQGAVFDWSTGLPALAELTPGASFHEEAMLTTPGFLPPRPFTTDLEIIGEEMIEVAGCEMPALKMVVKNREAGKDLGENTKWLHLPSLVTLKSEIREGDSLRGQEVVVME
ncbi:MAG: hypothetical protein IPL38_11030 [Rhodobacter sp.]|jgi:hypothetical protein|nr:hypothetical protein [Rhodobacter sp.]